jgi:hypothetical protein
MRLDTYQRSPDAIARAFDGEMVLLNVATGDYFALNETGTTVWEAIGAPATVDDVASRISQRHDVDVSQAKGDVLDFLSELQNRGLVCRVASPNPLTDQGK